MVLEEASIRNITETDPRPIHIIEVSAKTKGLLARNIERLIAHLDAHPVINLANLSYTTTARRYQHSYRVAITTSDVAHLKKQLTSSLKKIDSIKPIGKSDPPHVAFTFTGQDASYKSMNLELNRDIITL